MGLSVSYSAADGIPAGWYTDPLAPADVRWWTGQEWTHHVQPRPVPSPAEPADELVDAGSL